MRKIYSHFNWRNIALAVAAPVIESGVVSVGNLVKNYVTKILHIEYDDAEYLNVIPFVRSIIDDDSAKVLHGRYPAKRITGNIVFRYENRIVHLKEEFYLTAGERSKRRKRFVFTFIGASDRMIDDFSDRIARFRGAGINVMMSMASYPSSPIWQFAANIPYRKKETIVLPTDIVGQLVEQIEKFESSEEENVRKGVPHHLGILLKGKPGTSKTSIIHALASVLNRDLYHLDMTDLKKSRDITSLMAEATERGGIVVLEDFDASGSNVENRAGRSIRSPEDIQAVSNRMSMSHILNALDGHITPTGMILIATTNHPENIDPAILRPGRFDVAIDVPLLGYDEFVQMAHLMDLDPSKYELDYFIAISGATMRSALTIGGIDALIELQQGLHASARIPNPPESD